MCRTYEEKKSDSVDESVSVLCAFINASQSYSVKIGVPPTLYTQTHTG